MVLAIVGAAIPIKTQAIVNQAMADSIVSNLTVCYRRMLRNYSALTPEEVKDLCASCACLAEKDAEVKSDEKDAANIKALLGNILTEDRKIKSQEALRELQIRYDVNSLQAENNKLELEKRDLVHANDDKLISIVLVSLFVMAIVLMLLCRGYFRLKADNRLLTEDNDKLKKTIEELLDDGKPAGSTDVHEFGL